MALYDAIRKASVSEQRVAEATRGAILARALDGIPLLIETIRSPSLRLSNMALSSINAQTGGVRGLDQNGNSTRGRNALTDGDPGLSLGTGSDQPPGN